MIEIEETKGDAVKLELLANKYGITKDLAILLSKSFELDDQTVIPSFRLT